MGSEPSHEAAVTSTGFRICIRKTTNARRVSMRTFTARIHSTFSSVLSALHSLRTIGFVHEHSSYEDTCSTDQRKVRAIERSL
jgi:hypothetical protein